MDERKLVVLVAVQARRQVHFIKPSTLVDREPVVFRTMLRGNRLVPTGPYCAVDFAQEKKKRSCWSYNKGQNNGK